MYAYILVLADVIIQDTNVFCNTISMQQYDWKKELEKKIVIWEFMNYLQHVSGAWYLEILMIPDLIWCS